MNMLLDLTPHPLGMYALLADGRRAINLVWASEADPSGHWLEWDGPRYRDHFALCDGGATLRTARELASAAVEGIGEPNRAMKERVRRMRSRRLRDWP